MRIPSGSTDRFIYFVTTLDGLSSFTVYRSRNGGAAVQMTTPTINEIDSANMTGVYSLQIDEDTTIAAGHDTEEMVFFITHDGIDPIARTIELYRPKATEGNTLVVNSSGEASTTGGSGGGGSSTECPCPCPGDQMLHPHLQ